MVKQFQEFSGKVALVTGGGSGMGRATAIGFAASGAYVVIVDKDEAGLDQTRDLIAAVNGQATSIVVDVANSTDVKAAVAAAMRINGKLDFSVNAAGIVHGAASLTEHEEEVYDRTFAINAKGIWLCMKYEILAMRKNSSSAIVNIASTAAIRGSPGLAIYAGSKHAVLGLTRSAALEYAASNIRINAVCPGATETPMGEEFVRMSPSADAMNKIRAAHPLGRVARAEEMASAALWLCSEEAEFVTGQELVVDGGYTVGRFPG